jgi:hypothetical protein
MADSRSSERGHPSRRARLGRLPKIPAGFFILRAPAVRRPWGAQQRRDMPLPPQQRQIASRNETLKLLSRCRRLLEESNVCRRERLNVKLALVIGSMSRNATKSASRCVGSVVLCVCFLLVGPHSTDAGLRSAIAPGAATYRSVVACPSLEFRKFFDAFVGDASAQRHFTRLPIIFGKTDMLSPGDPFERRKIQAYEAIPTFNSKDGGRIFPSKEAQLREQFDVAMKEGMDEDFELPVDEKLDVGANVNGVIVVLHIQDSGFHIYYRFRKRAKCWFLVAIDDKST